MIENNQYFINKSFRNYLIPSILSILGGNISIMIDNCMAGVVLGESALAAMSIANPVFSIITAIGLLICGGASMLASVSIGSNDIQKKHTYFTLAFYLTFLVGSVITVAGLIALDPMIIFLGAKGELFQMARDYCRVLLGGSSILMAVYFPLNFFRIEGCGRIGMIMFAIMSILDIIFDYLFVVIFHWDMTGLALATILSSLIAVISVFPLLFKKRLGYCFVRLEHPIEDVKQLLYKGSPLALGNLYSVIRVCVLNSVFLKCGGSLALAAYACANNINIIGMAFITGIGQTVAPIVGVLYGERDGTGIKNIVNKAVKTGLIATLCFSGIVILLGRQLTILFGMTSPQQLKTAQLAISILSTNLVFAMISSVLIYSYMTCNRTGFANLLTLFRGVGFVLPFVMLGARIFGTVGALIGMVAAEAGTVLLAFVMTALQRRKNSDYEGILLLSHKMFFAGHSMVCSTKNTSQSISETANQGALFCMEQGLSDKEAMIVSLGVEEIMVLLSKYALSQPEQMIEFRLFISKLETVVRIRCEGKWFNPMCFQVDDELENMGVKILLGMAKGMSYSTNLGMNNIQITI